MKTFFVLLFVIASSPILTFAQAQSIASSEHRTEVAAEYSYVHANAPPAECGCFSLNGGSVSIAQPFRSGHFAFAFDTTIIHGSNIGSGKYGLTLSTFTTGVRYRPFPRSPWNPFGELLVGAAHASGSLVEGPTPAASDPALVFASTIGGGLDRRLTDHWSLRLIEADYLLTTYSNRTNDHQNNLRLSVGAAYHFGKR